MNETTWDDCVEQNSAEDDQDVSSKTFLSKFVNTKLIFDKNVQSKDKVKPAIFKFLESWMR